MSSRAEENMAAGMRDQTIDRPYRTGTVAIVGRPNVGKSTLLNGLIGFKLSAVSPKPQTTRHRILGVLTGENYQVAFLDTPGLPFNLDDELNRRLLARLWEAVKEADVVVMMVEPSPPADLELGLIGQLKRSGKPCLLVINKIDVVKKPDLLPVINAYNGLYPFLEIVPVSALKSEGVEDLLPAIVKHLPEGEPAFPADELTDRSERFLASEMVREQVFHAYAQEVPYAVAVEIEQFREGSEEHGGKDHICAVLYVERESQKAILIGKGGQLLKKVGTRTRQQIEEVTGRPAYLELLVKVYPKWRKDRAFLQRIGY
jgi:GTPase